MLKNIVVTGASRGIGLGLTTIFVESEHNVIATSTNPFQSDALIELKENYPEHLEVLSLDCSNEKSVEKFIEDVTSSLGSLDLLVNNAGVFATPAISGIEHGNTIPNLDYESIEHVLKVNSIAPLLITQGLRPLLEKAMEAKVINISSGMGSLSDSPSSNYIPYRMSKAALNMATRTLAASKYFKEIPVVSVTPGWVQTDMGGPNAEITVSQSVETLLEFINNVDLQQTGGFFNRHGETFPF